jgi:hypothetical protein
VRTDYHLHTPLCRHAVGAPRDYVMAAQRAGLAEIGFSDHNPMPTQFDDWRMGPGQLPEYLDLIAEARHEFPHYPIWLGLECDFIPGHENHIRALAAQADWDYLIGSVHYISPDWDVDNPKHLKRWNEQPVEEVWQAYFDAYRKMVESCLFDGGLGEEVGADFFRLEELEGQGAGGGLVFGVMVVDVGDGLDRLVEGGEGEQAVAGGDVIAPAGLLHDGGAAEREVAGGAATEPAGAPAT